MPIILVTGEEDTGLEDAAVRRGAQDCLVRANLNPRMLGRVARHAVERQRLASGLRAAVERLHRSETRLREAKGRLAAILDAVPLSVVQLDREGRPLMVTRRPGFLPETTHTPTSLGDHLPLEAATRLQWNLDLAIQTATEQRWELTTPRTDGRPGTWMVHLTPMLDETGDVGSITATFRDVSTDRLLERRAERSDRMATVGMLATTLAAEINNPMTVVLANAQALQDSLREVACSARETAPGTDWIDAFEGELSEMASDIATGAERVQGIVTNLHRHVDACDHDETVIDPRSAVETAMALARPRLGAGIGVSVRLDPAPHVRVDEHRLVQVVVDLICEAAAGCPANATSSPELQVHLEDSHGTARLTLRSPAAGPSEAASTDHHGLEQNETSLAFAQRFVSTWGGQVRTGQAPDGGRFLTIMLPAAPQEHTLHSPAVA